MGGANLRWSKREGAERQVVLFSQGHEDCLYSKAKLIQTHSPTTKMADVKKRNHHLLVRQNNNTLVVLPLICKLWQMYF